jgi:phosphoribosylamine--glycine ligase
MRFLGVTETCDLASLYMRLCAEGHEVRVAISDPGARGTGAGLIDQVEDWRAELDWIREAGVEGIILFEAVSEGFGELQDNLRRDGFQVIGGSGFGDRLENDRGHAQALLADLGFPSGHVWEFDNPATAERFIARRPARYVLKHSGPAFASHDNYLGQLADGRDVRALLRQKALPQNGSFILMEFIEGVEMGIGAYFDGDRFLRPACLDWEHKRFFAGDLGELTGEMGTVATYSRSERFFHATLARIEPLLRGKGHVGYVNLNTIVNEKGIWPLEFTCRFGYPGFAVLEPLQKTTWGALFRMMVSPDTGQRWETRSGFSLAVVLTTPPFPYTRREIDEPIGLPILLPDPLPEEDRRNIHFGETGMADGQLVTSGLYGWTAVITGTGRSISAAREQAYDRVSRILVPNGRYRLDIGERLINGDYAAVEALRLLDLID